jgi:hypothetical protein
MLHVQDYWTFDVYHTLGDLFLYSQSQLRYFETSNAQPFTLCHVVESKNVYVKSIIVDPMGTTI